MEVKFHPEDFLLVHLLSSPHLTDRGFLSLSSVYTRSYLSPVLGVEVENGTLDHTKAT